MSSVPRKQAHLTMFVHGHGQHLASWRHPDAPAGIDFAHYKNLAQIAEAAKFDALFFADVTDLVPISGPGSRPESLTHSARGAWFDPPTLIAALSSVTQNIGLIATATTTYHEPYHVARKFSSLDHLSGGRAGWNLVTSSNEAEAKIFGRDHLLEHAKRYERANEFIDVVMDLWDSWEDDAFLRDKASGQYSDASKVHVVDHKGPHFQVQGLLNLSRSPQGHPVRVQAGSSEPGKDLAARTAEVVFTAHRSLESAKRFYGDVKDRLSAYGRHRDDLKILPGLFPVVGRTQAEAEAKFQQIQDLVHPAVGLGLLSTNLGGFDLSAYPLDEPLPELPLTNGNQSRQALLIELARRENLTIRQLYLQIAGGRGHKQVVGTPQVIADLIEEWLTQDAADGFNIMPPTAPGSLTDFVELVVPELRRRGLFRSEYEGSTLRENFGLRRPSNRHQLPASAEVVQDTFTA